MPLREIEPSPSLAVIMKFPESVPPRVLEVIHAALPRNEWPLDSAMAFLSHDAYRPVLAEIVCSLSDSPMALQVGTALELMQVGLQKLHARVEEDVAAASGLDNATRVLVGDYLTSGAFKLVARCDDLRILRAISDAMSETCELEVNVAGDRSGARRDEPTMVRPLGLAAGIVGAYMAGYTGCELDAASRFGQAVTGASARLHESVLRAGNPSQGIFLRSARRLLREANHYACVLHDATTNPHPVVLAATLIDRAREGR
jgi:octaprenyl-diphosphate synthase